MSVLPVWPAGSPRTEEPEGSGIVIAPDGLIATADHVIGPARQVLVRTVSGEVLNAEIMLRDAATDIALLRISRLLMKPVRPAETVPAGGEVCALGNGFGLGISITCGVVSATQMSGLGFNRIEDFVQTDAAVNPGMSGGALVDREGRLVGMLSAIFTKKSDSNIGVNFAVSASLLTHVVDDYLDDGQLTRISPGIRVTNALKAGETGLAGARVEQVASHSSEARAGLVEGDVILFAGERRIKRAGAYTAALALLKKGSNLNLKILRGRKRKAITVKYR